MAANHVSYIDPAALGCACPRILSFVARDTLFKVPILGLWMRCVGCIPVKRKSADLGALRESMQKVKSGGVLGLFPEGTRQTGGISDKAEAGVGFLASKCKAPVIPALILGTDKVLPRGAKFLRPGKIKVIFGEPIEINSGLSYELIATSIMQDIRKIYEKQQNLR